MERERKKMKTCNGCEHLECEKDDLIRDDNDNTVFCECRYDRRFEGHYIGWFDKDEPIPTPYWCPKETENVQ